MLPFWGREYSFRSPVLPTGYRSPFWPFWDIPDHHLSLAISRKDKEEYVLSVNRVFLVFFLPGPSLGQWVCLFQSLNVKVSFNTEW